MGPGRLTGMNAPLLAVAITREPRFNGARSIDRDERERDRQVGRVAVHASMGPGRLTGMNAPCAQTSSTTSTSFNGARSIDRDERVRAWLPFRQAPWLQWGPVD